MSTEKIADFSLEQALERLEEIAQQMEGSELELSDSLALYEEGVRLLRQADSLLGTAEQRVQQLRTEGDGFRLEPLSERA